MKRLVTLFILLSVGLLVLAGCAGSEEALADSAGPSEPASSQAQATDATAPAPDAQAAAAAPLASTYEAQVSDAGGVTIEVTPLNLSGTGQETLQFQAALNTHSVDLSFDLAQLAVLRTDQGNEVAGLEWDAPRGGHHVGGTLSFPAIDLEGVQWVEIVLRDVAGVPERVLHWDLEVAP